MGKKKKNKGQGSQLEGELSGGVLVRPEGSERRILGRDLELRVSEGEGEGEPLIEGYAALFDVQSEDLGGFIETIEAGAFAGSIAESDVRALFNHDRGRVLGRTKAGTLELAEDQTGLRVRIRPPGATWARDLLASMRRGDVDQMSFGFETIRDRWETIAGQLYRRLLEVRLIDVSVVTFPAYQETIAEVREMAASYQSSEAGRGAGSGSGDGEQESRGRLSVARARLALAEVRAPIK